MQHSHSREKVFGNSLLQAKRVLVDCRGFETGLEAVRVSENAAIEVVREPVVKTVLKNSGTHQNVLGFFQSF